MESSLTELFEQIIHSEQKAQQRKSLLNEVRSEITLCQDEILKTKQDQNQLQQQLAQTVNDLNEDVTRLKWFTAKQKALRSQKQQLLTEDTELAKQLNDVESQIQVRADNFCQEATKFSHGYDFCNQGVQGRELEAKKKLEDLKAEEQKLRNELSSFKTHQKNVELLKEKKKDADRKAGELRNIVEGLEQQVDDQRLINEALLLQKEKVANLPHTDPEFLKLQADMETLKNDGLEGMCSDLQQELQQLQQQVWQSKLKKRRPQMMGQRQRGTSEERSEPPVLERQAPHPLSTRPARPNLPRLSQALKRKQQEEQELIGVGKLLDADGDFEAEALKLKPKTAGQ